MADSDRIRWEAKYAAGGEGDTAPAAVLTRYAHLLPERGRALDLACGRGANALFLAQRGLETRAWDISAIAIDALVRAARHAGLDVEAEQRDVIEHPPRPGSFDVIVVSRFLDRGLVPALIAALRPSGTIFYQTFLGHSVNADGPRNPAYRLERDELPRLFAALDILVHHEGKAADETSRDEAMLVARVPGTG